MTRARRIAAGAGLALATCLVASVTSAAAAGGWWVPAPGRARSISALASDQGQGTLAIAGGGAGWYRPETGGFPEIAWPRDASTYGPPIAVAAAEGLGVVAFRNGRLLQVGGAAPGSWLSPVAGVPQALAVSTAAGQLAVASSRGLFSGRLGRRLELVAPGDAMAVLAPAAPGLDWVALVGGRLWLRAPASGWIRSPRAPVFARKTRALAELASGLLLVGEPGGLVWRGSASAWERVFQVLPYGGLGGVPQVTAAAADGPSAAYLATDGFGTLLTPDGGYSWYRAAPANSAIAALATVGPVFSARPRGFVIAVSRQGVYLHRLQALPQPPTYTPTNQAAELEGTAAVTLGAALLVILLLWYGAGRRRRLSV